LSNLKRGSGGVLELLFSLAGVFSFFYCSGGWFAGPSVATSGGYRNKTWGVVLFFPA
jgi:hypothetical protein